MADRFERFSSGLDSPAFDAAAVTPNDSVDLTVAARALYIGGAGNVELTTTGGTTLVFTGVPAGSILPVRTVRVLAGDTTATSIVALF